MLLFPNLFSAFILNIFICPTSLSKKLVIVLYFFIILYQDYPVNDCNQTVIFGIELYAKVLYCVKKGGAIFMDSDYIRERFKEMSDEALKTEINENGAEYTEEALRIAKEELETRKWTNPDFGKKIYKRSQNRTGTNSDTARMVLYLIIIFIFILWDITTGHIFRAGYHLFEAFH